MAIKLEHVNYIYGADTELSVAALKDVNLSIEDGQFIGLSAIPVRESPLWYSI